MKIEGTLDSMKLLAMDQGSKDAKIYASRILSQCSAQSLICSLAIMSLYEEDSVGSDAAEDVMPTMSRMLYDVYNDLVTAQNVAGI